MGEQINIGSLVADLDIKTTNLEANMANAGSALYEVKVKIADLQRAFKSGAVGAAEFADRMQFLTMSQTQLEDALANATAATVASTSAYATGAKAAGGFGSSVSTASSQSKQAAVAMMQLGYAVDDLQYGFRGVVNNIAPFVYSVTAALGKSKELAAGLATAAQIGVVFAYQLYTHWDQVLDLFGVGIENKPIDDLKTLQDELKKTGDEIEKLAKKPRLNLSEKIKLDEDRKKEKTLEDAVKAQKDLESLTSGQSRQQREQGSAFKDAVAETGGKAALAELEAALNDKAEQEGVGLNVAQVKDKAKQKGITLTDAQAKALSEKKFLTSHQTGELITPEKMAQEEMIAAGKGDTEAIDRIAAITDARAGGDMKSPLSQNIYMNSPDREEEIKANDRKAALAKKEREDQEKRDKELKTAREKQAKEDAAAEEKQVKDSAKGLLSGPAMLHALNKGLTPENVEEALKNSGMQAEQAHKLAPKVQMRADQDAQEKVRDYALKHGMTEDQARGALANDERQQFTDDASKRAKKLAPSLDEFAQNRVAGAMMSGDPRNMDTVRAEIAAKLRELDMKDGKQDMTDEQIDAASNATVDEAQQDIEKKVRGEKPEQQKQEKSKAEQFDAAALASKVQGGVGTPLDEQKKSNTYLEQAVKYLAKMSGNGGAGGDPFSIG